jgi:hypothetical protein
MLDDELSVLSSNFEIIDSAIKRSRQMNKLQAHEVKLQATLKHNGFEMQNDAIGERIQF